MSVLNCLTIGEEKLFEEFFNTEDSPYKEKTTLIDSIFGHYLACRSLSSFFIKLNALNALTRIFFLISASF